MLLMIEDMPIHPELQVFILVYMRLSVVFCTLHSNLVKIIDIQYIESIPYVILLLYILCVESMYHVFTLLHVLLIESKYYVSILQYILYSG